MYRNSHPWRLMTAVFGGVLLCSFLVEMLFSPWGEAVLNRLDRRQAKVAGEVGPSASDGGKLVLHDGPRTYILMDQGKAKAYSGRYAQVTGVLHESTRVLEIRGIELAARP